MNEKIPTSNFEKSPILSESEVMDFIKGLTGKESSEFEEVTNYKDENGDVYRLVMKTIGDDRDPVYYDYVRAGKFPENGGNKESNSSETALDKILFDESGRGAGGKKAASFVDGAWVMETD